jgi:hypothetical protein
MFGFDSSGPFNPDGASFGREEPLETETKVTDRDRRWAEEAALRERKKREAEERALAAKRAEKAAVEKARKEELGRLTSERDKVIQRLKSKEDELLGAMTRQGEISQEAIDKQLASLVGQTGYLADVSGQAMGSNMYQRGIGRSGIAAEAQAGIRTREQSLKGQFRSEADMQKDKVKNEIELARKQVLEKRQRVERQILDMQIQTFQSEDYLRQTQAIENEYKEFVMQLELSAAERQAMADLFGGLGQLTGLGIGYMYGGDK